MFRSNTAKIYCGDLWGSVGLRYTFGVQMMTECHSSVWQRIEQRVATEEARWRVSRVTMMLGMLREFLTIEQRFETQSPRQVLDRIRTYRFQLWRMQHTDSFPAEPMRELFHSLVLKEMDLYHNVFPNPLRQAAADAAIARDDGHLYGDLIKTALEPASNVQAASLEQSRMIATDPARRRELLYRYLEQLRCHLSDEAVQKGLDRPFGKGLTKGREKTEGMSIKIWPVVGICIWDVYEMLLPLYPSKPRSPKSLYDGPAPELAEYPQELLKDIVELFTTEFPDALNDLTEKDVKSRIQYQLKKLREQKSDN